MVQPWFHLWPFRGDLEFENIVQAISQKPYGVGVQRVTLI